MKTTKEKRYYTDFGATGHARRLIEDDPDIAVQTVARLQRERDAALSRIEKAREVLERVHEAGEDLCEYETLINHAHAVLTSRR